MSKHGDWYWHELTTPDAEGAKRFYKAVAGWDSRDQDMGEMGTYTLWTRDGADHGGMMKMEGPMWDGIPPHWMLYIAVDDCDASKAAVEANGGKVKYGPIEAPGVGRFIGCEDPQGAVFTLMQPEAAAG